jgi:hypothetical protein
VLAPRFLVLASRLGCAGTTFLSAGTFVGAGTMLSLVRIRLALTGLNAFYYFLGGVWWTKSEKVRVFVPL